MDKTHKPSRKYTERISQLYHFYETNEAETVMGLLESRGPNSWINVLPKVNALMQRSYAEQEYDDMLYDEFSLNKEYSFQEQIRIVTSVRSRLRLPLYMDRTKKQCEQELLRLFIVKKAAVPNPNGPGQIITGLIPIFKLKPED